MPLGEVPLGLVEVQVLLVQPTLHQPLEQPCLGPIPTRLVLSVAGEAFLVRTSQRRRVSAPHPVSIAKCDVAIVRPIHTVAAASQDGPTVPVTTGTASPPYSSYNEKDPTTNTNLQYQSITALPAYRGTSLDVCFQELPF